MSIAFIQSPAVMNLDKSLILYQEKFYSNHSLKRNLSQSPALKKQKTKKTIPST